MFYAIRLEGNTMFSRKIFPIQKHFRDKNLQFNVPYLLQNHCESQVLSQKCPFQKVRCCSEIKVSLLIQQLSLTSQDEDAISDCESSAALFIRSGKLGTSLLRGPQNQGSHRKQQRFSFLSPCATAQLALATALKQQPKL